MKLENLLFDQAFHSYGYGIVCFDRHQKLRFKSTRAQSYFPDFFPEHAGKTQQDFLTYLHDHAESFDDAFMNFLGRSLNHNANINVQFREVVSWSGGVCFVEAQKLDCDKTIFVLRDITQLKESEEHYLKLNQYSYKLAQAIEAATNGIVIVSKQANHIPIITANAAFCDFIGVEQNEIENCCFRALAEDVLDDDTFQKLFTSWDDEGFVDADVTAQFEAQRRYLNLKFIPVKNVHGSETYFICVFTDITQLRKREEDSFKAQKLEALGQLSGGIAHDFNNIFSIIDGYARMIDSKAGEFSPALSGYTEKIRKNTRRGSDLIKKMLVFSRHKIISEDVICLSDVVRQHHALLKPLVQASIKLSVKATDEVCYIECSAENIIQILMNLTLNARDTIGDHGHISIDVAVCGVGDIPDALKLSYNLSTDDSAEYACLSISDDGTGIADDIRHLIFDPFFTTKYQGQGTGLGLSIVYGYVKEAGGAIDVVSQMGQGTKFVLYFPLTSKAPNKVIEGHPDALDGYSLKGYTALLAEDETDLRALVAEMLSDLGMNVIACADGNEALVKQDEFEGHIDLLLTDVVMPDLGGVRLAELFAELRPKTKIIFMSGYPATEHRNDMSFDPEKFIAKPIEYPHLARVIHRILSNDTSDQEIASASFDAGRRHNSEECS